MTNDQEFEHYLRVRRTEIETALEAGLPTPPACPALIADAMRYSLLAGGKRLRPILTLAAAESVDVRNDPGRDLTGSPSAMPAACAVELIHTYSLIHDDLPSMDDDDVRRGRPTAHVVYGDAVAILAGDALLTHAFEVLARPEAEETPPRLARRLRAIARLAGAAGAAGMVGGQVLDVEATGNLTIVGDGRAAPETGHEALREIHERKTGALIGAAAAIGAILAGADHPTVAAIDAYSTHLGLAFQIVDDILDVEGSVADLGKTTGKDAVAGKPTYPAVHGVARSRALATNAAAAARDALAEANLGGRLGEIADWVVSRRQ